jgi:cell division transport system permease protein
VRLQYLLTNTGQSIRRNPLVVASAVVVVLVMLVLFFGSILVRWSIERDIGAWDDNVRVIAFLGDDQTPDQVAALSREISSWETVDDVIFFDKAQALAEFNEMFADEPSMLEVVQDDPSVLPASLRIKPTAAADYTQIRDRLAVLSGIQQVEAADETIDAMVLRSERWQTFAVGVFIIVGAAALILIANTIRMAVYARREEISIMKLVGAGNWFVRVPFYLEGLFEGIAGALIAIGIVTFFHQPIVELFNISVGTASIEIPWDFLVRQSLLVLLFGAGTGLLGSALGMVGVLRD